MQEQRRFSFKCLKFGGNGCRPMVIQFGGSSTTIRRDKADPRLDIPDKVGIGLGKGSERTAKRILELLVDGPMRPSALREAVGTRSPIHFSRYYLRPLMEKGMIERTDPDSPKSPRQEYKLA